MAENSTTVFGITAKTPINTDAKKKDKTIVTEINPFILEKPIIAELGIPTLNYNGHPVSLPSNKIETKPFLVKRGTNVFKNREMELAMYLIKEISIFKLLWYITNRLSSDVIQITQEKVGTITGISKNKYYAAISALIDVNVIAKTGKNNMYWVNPHLVSGLNIAQLEQKYLKLAEEQNIKIIHIVNQFEVPININR